MLKKLVHKFNHSYRALILGNAVGTWGILLSTYKMGRLAPERAPFWLAMVWALACVLFFRLLRHCVQQETRLFYAKKDGAQKNE